MDINDNVQAEETVVEETVTEDAAVKETTEDAVEEAVAPRKVSMEKKDLISSVVVFLFGLFVLISGIDISATSQALADSAWYGTPGMFPIFIGAALMIFSAIMFGSLIKAGVRIDKDAVDKAKVYFKSQKFIKLLVAIGFFAIYVFVLFRYVPFLISTFVYLAATMIFFRDKKVAIWKILIISAAFTGFLYVFFGIVAGVPLP